ncbi:uncharacterized protein METZ01_LOCUS329780 [marine metagenome]|uniref:Uncharacterized protein n=1 Tax=marine metagenome TaxID=408172 RepID=A0A382PUL1_9ZZZZ
MGSHNGMILSGIDNRSSIKRFTQANSGLASTKSDTVNVFKLITFELAGPQLLGGNRFESISNKFHNV